MLSLVWWDCVKGDEIEGFLNGKMGENCYCMKGKLDCQEALLTINRSHLALVYLLFIYAIDGEIAFICSHKK
jgi:hypothetical protein